VRGNWAEEEGLPVVKGKGVREKVGREWKGGGGESTDRRLAGEKRTAGKEEKVEADIHCGLKRTGLLDLKKKKMG